MSNPTSRYEISIFCPLYNEVDNLPRLEKALSDFLPGCRKKACVLFVNDGSTDGSLPLLQEICSRNPDFYYISIEHAGVTTAYKTAIDAVESEFLGYIDADLQTNPEDLNLLLDSIGDNSMAIGIRVKRKDTWFYRFQSKFGNAFRNLFTHDGAQDTGCPLRVIRTSVAKQFPLFNGLHRFQPAMALLQEGGSFVQVPVRHYPRTAGKSKFNIWNRAFSGLVDCFAFVYIRKRTLHIHIQDSNL